MNTITPFSEKLKPLAQRMRERRPTVEPISQINFTIVGDGSNSPVDAGIAAIMPFIERRAGAALPDDARQGRSFSLDEIGSRRVDGIAIDEPRYWTVRFDDDDAHVPQRSWIIEAAIAEDTDDKAQFGMRLQCIARAENPPYTRSIPSFVRDVIERCDVRLDGRRLTTQPWIVDDEASVETLVTLLESSSRIADVIAVSLPEGVSDPAKALVRVDGLARDLAGAAHVAVITGDATFGLSDRVGKEFSVFRSAVRTYRPGFDPGTEEPFAHPLGLPQRIESWSGGPGGYRKFITSNVLERTVGARDAQRRMPSFAEAKRTATALRRRTAKGLGSSSDELLVLAEQEIEEGRLALETIKAEADGLLAVAEAERDEATAEAERLRAAFFHAQSRIGALEAAKPAGEIEELPSDLTELEDWANRHLAGAVTLHNRALKGARESEYEDETLVYRALLLLRDRYVPMKRTGGLELKEAYEQACAELELEDSGSISRTEAGRQGDTYFIRVGKHRVFLDRHLKKSTNREPRYGFRLYFTWDDATQQVLVGWLPSHLQNRLS